MKASSWPLATSCSSLKSNISALRTACPKAIKRNNNDNNSNNNNNNNNNNDTHNNKDLFASSVFTMTLCAIEKKHQNEQKC